MSEFTKYTLSDKDIPSAWVNVLPRLKEPLEMPLHPGTHKPLGPEDLAPIFPMSLIEQEFSQQPEIDIPGEVLDIYKLWRPTPLYRARRLEKALDTPAKMEAFLDEDWQRHRNFGFWLALGGAVAVRCLFLCPHALACVGDFQKRPTTS